MQNWPTGCQKDYAGGRVYGDTGWRLKPRLNDGSRRHEAHLRELVWYHCNSRIHAVAPVRGARCGVRKVADVRCVGVR
jgi:hypothetical protein